MTEHLRVNRLFLALLSLLAISAFTTELKFVPGLVNNIALFEVTTVLLVAGVVIVSLSKPFPFQGHPQLWILTALVLVASFSLLNVGTDRQIFAIVQTAILSGGLVITWVLYTLMVINPRYFAYLLRVFALAASIAALWLLVDQVLSGGSINANGPFRNRAHSGIIMLTSFWIVLGAALLPDTSKRMRFGLLLLTLPAILYAIGASGRRSVYVALVLGIGGLLSGTIWIRGRSRITIMLGFVPAIFAVGSIFFFSSIEFEPITFAQARIGTVEQRLREFTAPSIDDVPEDRSFNVLQREGALHALREHPFIGIGWGGFANSPYSPTGHEMHSTPLRFLAETGIVGLVLYLAFMGMLLFRSFRLFWRSRGSRYELVSLVFWIGLCSISVSHIYNRSVTERTFWLMLALYLAYETILTRNVLNRRAL